ncbi:MAG: cupin domain-containing protein [Peptococcaceae bacterium]
MFVKNTDCRFIDMAPGVQRKTLAYGDKTLLAEFSLAKGSTVPEHSHPHEQTGYLISGKMIFIMDEQKIEVNPGDSWAIPGGVPHKVNVMEDSRAIEVFSPVREDYK